MSGIAIVNGTLVDPSAPAVSVFDAAVLHGDAYFETLRTYDGRPALLPQHLARLNSAITAAGFPDPPSATQLEDEVAAAINEFSEGDVVIRVSVSRGVREFGLGSDPESTTRIVTAHLLTSSKAGMDATVTISDLPGYAYPHKSANYQLQSSLLRVAREFGFDEVLIAEDEELIEGATSNVFLIIGEELVTPELGRCLPGITRQAVLDIAQGCGLAPVERIVSPLELHEADGVFICNSLIELRAVTNYGKASARIPELREALLHHYRGDAI
jgi:branched-subunit amino acid aminotransferase/4-amino-4-deoxychorismate lyase